MKKNCLFLLTFLLLAPSVKAQPIRVIARRFERQPTSPYGFNKARLKANVVLSGSAFHAMSGYGDWKISEARDDKGTDLRPKNANDLAENAAVSSLGTFDVGYLVGAQGNFFLAMPSPQAKRATLVRGTVAIVSDGRLQSIVIPHITRHFGGRLSSPVLDVAGLQITVEPPEKNEPKTLRLNITGNLAALQSDVGMTDAKGHKVSSGFSTSSTEGSNQELLLLYVKQPLDDGMTLHLRVLTHTKTRVVPFELRDVPLPSFAQMKLDDTLMDAVRSDSSSNRYSSSSRYDPSIVLKIKELLARGADANARDSDGNTALYWRARIGDDASVRLLLAHRANPNIVSGIEGSSPLGDAMYFNHFQITLMLISHGANVNTTDLNGRPPLLNATFNHRLPLLRVLIQNGARVDTQTDGGLTPLQAATSDNWYPGVKALLDAGANPNLRADGKIDISTPLIDAAWEGDAKLTSLLLAHRANPNLANFKGETALIMLAQLRSSYFHAEHLRVARMLLAHGANVNARTKNGNTALKWAKVYRNIKLIQILQAAGARS